MKYSESLEQGRRALLTGDLERARLAFEESLLQDPGHAECWFLLGAVHHQTQKLDLARAAFFRASTLDPRHIQSRFALATVCLDLGDGKAAVSACLEATELAANDPQAWFSLGAAHEACNAHEEALAAYEHALLLTPDHAGALKNRRALLITIGQFDEAIKQCRSLVAKQPFSLEAQFNLGESLTAAQNFAEATRVFARAANLSPQNARVALHYGFALAQLERFSEAQKQLDHAARLDPALLSEYRQSIFGKEHGDAAAAPPRLDARALFLLRHYDAIECCDWRERSYFIERFAALIAQADTAPLTDRALGFRALSMGLDPALQLALARQIASGIQKEALPSCCPVISGVTHLQKPRLRVGYISPDFRNHPIGLMTSDLFAWHNRNRFEIFGYALGPDKQDDIWRTVVAGCDHFINFNDIDDEQAAKQIVDDSIDILIDLAGYTDRSRPSIFIRRPAPIQISWLGYAATMGAPWIDYLIADSVAVPHQDDQFYSEALIRMPAGHYLCSYATANLMKAPERQAERLPDIGIVLGAMHNSCKIDPEIFALWMRLLVSCEGSVLWLLDTGNEAKKNLKVAAYGHGIDPGRLIFAPNISHAAHLERLQLADLILDTPQCNGSSTISDALVAGVPVLTCIGATFAQRMAASLLHAAGQDNLIVLDLGQYEKIALDLMKQPERLSSARKKIAASRSNALFFRPRDWVRHFESGLERVWHRRCENLPPQSIEIGA